jgi:chromate reductase
MVKLVLISGSLRRDSLNSTVIRAVERIALRHPQIEAVSILPLHDIPPFDEDVELIGDPPSVSAAKRMLDGADGLLLATPEYNGAMSGVLKNAIDWLSRPWGNSSMTAKPVATLSAAPGMGGGRKAQAALRPVLEELGADLVRHELVAVSGAGDRLDVTGELSDRAALAQLTVLVSALVARCTQVQPAAQRQPIRHCP